MVQINGSTFKVYDLDTLQSVLNRLSSQMSTIHRYLYFPKGIPTFELFLGDDDIEVNDILQLVKSYSSKGNIIGLRNELGDKINQQNLSLYEDIYLPFVAFNTQFEGIPEEYIKAILLNAQTEINNVDLFTGKMGIEEIWDDRDNIKNMFSTEIKAITTNVHKQYKLFDSFQQLSADTIYTQFELEQSMFEFDLYTPQISILELFNHLHLSPTVPFASINNFFKILKDFVPPDDWNISLPSAVFVKILQKAKLLSSVSDDYTDIIITVEDEKPDVSNVSMSIDSGGQYISRDAIIDRFLSTIKGLSISPDNVSNLKESRVKGSFYFPKNNLDRYVFADIVMNNLLFSSMITIDESDKATKQKDSIYIYFQHPKVGEVHANLTVKTAVKGDPYLRGKDINGDFKLGTTYIRVKVSIADNIGAVSLFQEMLSKLLVVYASNYNEIVTYYRKYLPKFPTTKLIPVPQVDDLKLKDIAPEVFVTQYPSKCSSAPNIIRDDQVEEEEEKGKIVMRYPKSDDEGFIQRNYVCNYQDFKFPGLMLNTLSNKETIPYLPCCYKNNHENKEGSAYRQYYYDEESTTGEMAGQQALLKTNKFTSRDEYADLPDDITKLFNMYDYKSGYDYVRKGVSNTLNSFLDCVMEGMYEETNILAYEDPDSRNSRLQEVRQSLAVPQLAAVCRQTMYDYTSEEIIEDIANPEVYFSPEVFVPLLEHYFDCNIYVFSRVGKTGKLTLPRHSQAFYKTRRPEAKTIFVYEHMGSKSDNASYPHCELIVNWQRSTSDNEYYSLPKSPVALGIGKLFALLRQSYSLNRSIPETVFPIDKVSRLIEQGVDSYGKCRMLRVHGDGDRIITIITSPIPPFALPVVSGWAVTTPEVDTILDFAAAAKITITGQSVVQGVTKEIFGRLHTVTLSFPVTDSVPISGVPEFDRGISYPIDTSSVLDNYNRYKKLARYVVEYSYWLFSHYIQDHPGTRMDLTGLAAFVDDKISIIEDFEYGDVPKRFDLSSGVMKDGKLVVRSEEALKRLVYTMRVFIRRYSMKILDYFNRANIENYYLDITDFDQFQFQVILMGEDSISKWATEQKNKRYLYKSIQFTSRKPYFFRNDLVGNSIFLAQNTNSLVKAINIIEVWLGQGYNPGETPDDIGETSSGYVLPTFTLYSYMNETDINEYTIKGIATPYNIKIVGYKVTIDGRDEAFYTALLSL